jgi:hypothetical protein
MNTLMLLPNPINIIIGNNTFIRFIYENGDEEIGLVFFLDHRLSSVTVRLFLTWSKLSEMIGLERLETISLWPKQFSTKMPTYLCDSDVENNCCFEQDSRFGFCSL